MGSDAIISDLSVLIGPVGLIGSTDLVDSSAVEIFVELRKSLEPVDPLGFVADYYRLLVTYIFRKFVAVFRL